LPVLCTHEQALSITINIRMYIVVVQVIELLLWIHWNMNCCLLQKSTP
jgi:hypothetical protein